MIRLQCSILKNSQIEILIKKVILMDKITDIINLHDKVLHFHIEFHTPCHFYQFIWYNN